jgi:hypothetical protein
MGPEASRWLAYRHEVPGARLRLFCLGGGGASMFGLWDLGMPAGVEVCPLQLPGRENRLGELPMIRISRIADSLSQAFAPWLDQPFALFGHSAGALILLCQTGSRSCIRTPVRRKVPLGGNSSPLGATPARKDPPKGT